MTGARLRLDDKDAQATLDGLADALDDLRPFFLAVGEHVQATTIDRFRREVSPAGVPWAPLNEEYAKTKKGPGILRETGRLAEIIYQIAGSVLLIGTNAVYAAAHQFGATIVPKTAAALVFSLGGRTVHAAKVQIPKREFLGLTEDDRAEIRAIGDDFLAMAAGGAGEIA